MGVPAGHEHHVRRPRTSDTQHTTADRALYRRQLTARRSLSLAAPPTRGTIVRPLVGWSFCTIVRRESSAKNARLRAPQPPCAAAHRPHGPRALHATPGLPGCPGGGGRRSPRCVQGRNSKASRAEPTVECCLAVHSHTTRHSPPPPPLLVAALGFTGSADCVLTVQLCTSRRHRRHVYFLS